MALRMMLGLVEEFMGTALLSPEIRDSDIKL